MNKELWSSEIAEQSPCGADLEYDPDFMALEQASLGKPEQQYGDSIIAAAEPNWREVEQQAEALLTRTKDIRVLLLLTRACTRNHGLPGLAAGLQAILTLLERNWDEVHPRLVIDGDEDPFFRINAVAGLADAAGLVRDVRLAVLVKSSLGPLLVKDAEAALDKNHSAESGLSREQLISICADAQAGGEPDLLALGEAERILRKISKLSDERFGEQHAPDISGLSVLLSGLVKALTSNATTDNAATDASVDSANPADTTTAQAASGNGISDIRSRKDAIRALDIVCHYLEKNEPTNPAPLLIKRAQRLMSLSFVDIIKELAPDSLGQIAVITGAPRE